jgi:hypothetical protein
MSRYSANTIGGSSSNMTFVADDRSDRAPSFMVKRDTMKTPIPPLDMDMVIPIDRRSATPRFYEIMIDGYGNGSDRTRLDREVNQSTSSQESQTWINPPPKLEGGPPKGPPPPVGFWNEGLRSTRRNAYVNWIKTSMSRSTRLLHPLTFVSRDSLCLHSYRALDLLGCLTSRRMEIPKFESLGRRFRRSNRTI